MVRGWQGFAIQCRWTKNYHPSAITHRESSENSFFTASYVLDTLLRIALQIDGEVQLYVWDDFAICVHVTHKLLVDLVMVKRTSPWVFPLTKKDPTQVPSSSPPQRFCLLLRMGTSKGQRLSGMQKQVLSLYRGFLRAARSKSDEERRKIESIVSQEFRRNSKQVDRKNFLYIEYLLRRGNKQLDQLRNPGTTGLSSLKVDLSKINNTDTSSEP
ncbi:Complex 1 LYR protein [Sesbania bispinosa]|nr:Complex 1 LYR protein [Sesbania bispinosa]